MLLEKTEIADKILCGDAFIELRKLPDRSVHCCVTSPPYWGLRDYGVEGQIGLEPTPELYVQHLVEVFREVKRVLRDDGTLWLNPGDSYVGANNTDCGGNENFGSQAGVTKASNQGKARWKGLPLKNLIGIPWQVAFALQADSWWLRSDIIWAKKSCMPSSVKDRPTSSHEHIFLLSRNRAYYYDYNAIKEPAICAGDNRGCRADNRRGTICNSMSGKTGTYRNKRDVWRVATQPFPDAHYAVYPPELIRPCILAGTSEKGCCPKCGAPWERVMEKGASTRKVGTNKAYGLEKYNRRNDNETTRMGVSENKTISWRPTCSCNANNPIPCIVLDPFMGAGTTGLVARQEGRHYLGIELDPEWAKKAQKRIYKECPMDRLI